MARNCSAPLNPGAALLLTDRAASKWLGLSRSTLWRRVRDGTLPEPIRIGGATRWRRDEILAALDRKSGKRDGQRPE